MCNIALYERMDDNDLDNNQLLLIIINSFFSAKKFTFEAYQLRFLESTVSVKKL